jgi:hypothetical protein
LHRGDTPWRMMRIPVGQERSELNSRSKKLQRCSQTVDEIAAAGIIHGTCYKILSDNLNISRVTQHSVPRVLTQDQCDDRMSICCDLIDSADKYGTFLNRIITGDERKLF